MIRGLFDLTGRTALVTGGSRGLGLGMARALAGAGARLVLNATRPGPLAESAAALRAEGHDVLEAAFDVTDEAAVATAFARLEAEGVAVDILMNNAGIQRRAPLLDMPAADWRQVMETNLTGAFLVGREAARRMAARGAGKIINIASVNSALARPTIGPYVAAKGGLRLLTQSMAAEWAPLGLQVNAIGPGYMLTEMTAPLAADPAFDGWVKGRTPARRWGRPEDLAGAAVFLASAASDYVNGQLLFVDGGMTAVV